MKCPDPLCGSEKVYPSHRRWWDWVVAPFAHPFRCVWCDKRFYVSRRNYKLYRAFRRRFCPHCGYDLRGSSGRCPECGTRVKFSSRRSHA